MEMMSPKRAIEAPKISEGLPVSLPVENPEMKNNIEERGGMDSTVGLKKTVIHQRQISGQH